MRDILHAGHDHQPTDDNADKTGPILLKVGSMVILFILAVAFVLLPFRLQRTSLDQSKLISYTNCVAGGVFLGFGIVHMLADAVEGFKKAAGSIADLSIIYLIYLAGFLSVLLVEKIVYTKILKRDQSIEPSALNTELNRRETITDDSNCSSECCDSDEKQHQHNQSSEHLHYGHFHTHDVPFHTNSRVTPYVITASLCFHSIFEGLSLGLLSQMNSIGILLLGLGLHKCAEGFAMGTSFVKSGTPTRIWVTLMLVFASVIPVGIAIGMVITSVGSGEQLVSSIFLALAAGAFLYVAVMGIIVEEFSGFDHLGKKFGLLIGGIVLICCLQILDFFLAA